MTCMNVEQFKTAENKEEMDVHSSFTKMIKDHDVKYEEKISEESSDQLSISIHYEKKQTDITLQESSIPEEVGIGGLM